MRYKLICGLGNPGPEYEHTYHNVGFLALAELLKRLEANNRTLSGFEEHKKLFAYIKTESATLLWPLTFMNDSGKAVKEALKKFHVQPAELLVLHDESDLHVGEWKTATARGAAGHHGIESILNAIGSNEFTRVRIGIRPVETHRRKAGEFVLSNIKKKDEETFARVFGEVISKLELAS